MIIQLKKRFSRQFTLSAHHTWSKHIDEATDYNSAFEPHLQWDARNELARSHFHRGHRFVAHAVAQSPWKAARGRGFGHNLLADFTFSGIVLARSGAPFNLNAGFDTIGDRHTDTHRPWGLGRNVGTGPAFLGFDMRLSRSFSIGEGMALQIVGEGFNILNKTNFKGGERRCRGHFHRRLARVADGPARARDGCLLLRLGVRSAAVPIQPAPDVLAREPLRVLPRVSQTGSKGYRARPPAMLRACCARNRPVRTARSGMRRNLRVSNAESPAPSGGKRCTFLNATPRTVCYGTLC